MEKICSKCGELKKTSEFYKASNQKSGYYPSCKDCKKATVSEYLLTCPEIKKRLDALYKQKRPEVGKKARDKYYSNNKILWTVSTAKRRVSKLNRTPSWLSKQDKAYIEYIYKFSRNISKYLGKEYHVDHIIPLQGDLVSGLHVPSNLQVIPAIDNLQKGNTWQIY